MTLLSGTQVSTGVGLWRLLLVCGYLVVCLAALGAIGLFVSTLTEQPIGATIGVVGLADRQPDPGLDHTAGGDSPVPADALLAGLR